MEEKDMPLATRQGASHPAPVASTLGLPWRLEDDVIRLLVLDANGHVAAEGCGPPASLCATYSERNRVAAARAAFIVRSCNSHAALVKALEAQEAADKADADAVDLVERATGEGWLYEPTGGSHINDAYATAARLRQEARDLARAALALATKET